MRRRYGWQEFKSSLTSPERARANPILTQVQLAERLGLDRSYLAEVEQGKRNISILNLEMFARRFGFSLSQLLARGWTRGSTL